MTKREQQQQQQQLLLQQQLQQRMMAKLATCKRQHGKRQCINDKLQMINDNEPDDNAPDDTSPNGQILITIRQTTIRQ